MTKADIAQAFGVPDLELDGPSHYALAEQRNRAHLEQLIAELEHTPRRPVPTKRNIHRYGR